MLQRSGSRGLARSLPLRPCASRPVDTPTGCVLCEGIDPTVVWERRGPPRGCDSGGNRLRAQHSPGFVSPAGMSIRYGTPPFRAVQSIRAGGIGRSLMPTSVPPANGTCTRGFRRRCADPLPGGGALAHRKPRRVRRGRDRMAAANRWSVGRARARRVGSQDRDDEIAAKARTASG